MDEKILIIVVACAVGSAIAAFFSSKGSLGDVTRPSIMTDDYTPTLTRLRAKVTDLACSSDIVGYNNGEEVRLFAVTFETEDGEILELHVNEEMYEGFEVGLCGELVLSDGEVYGFDVDGVSNEDEESIDMTYDVDENDFTAEDTETDE